MSGEHGASRVPMLKTLKDLAKSGAKLDASIITTYAFNGLFYEEVLLRALERAGSRLNIVLADAGQLTESLRDPLRRPCRAGRDYLLVPIPHIGAFHPKLLALLSERQSLFAVGSHNVTDAGFSHNEEVTAFWGAANPVPPRVLTAAVDYALQWLEANASLPAGVLAEITGRLRGLLPPEPATADDETSLIVSSAEEPLWSQIVPKVVGRVRRVTVVGPYFDARMDFITAIERDLEPSEIIIAVQPASAALQRPDLAPKTARFVDASGLHAFWEKAEEVGFAHGKALAVESEGGLVASLGSAIPPGAAWLAQKTWNAEANLCLTGETAAKVIAALGLDRLADVPALAPSQLAEIADRSQVARNQEQATAEVSGPRLISGQALSSGVFLRGFEVPDVGSFAWVEAGGDSWPVTLKTMEGGSLVALGGHRPGAGLCELHSGHTVIAFVLLNDAQALRAAALPRDGARILDHLGSMESGAGFTDLLDLLDKHVLSPADGTIRASSPSRLGGTTGAAPTESGENTDVPFGPRGVSLPAEGELALRRPQVSDGLIADIIAALIRALGAPPRAPPTDGDVPNLDEGDAGDAPSSDDLARNLDADIDVEVPTIDWPRLVTACRKRLTVMLRRLEARLDEATAADHPPGWALGRLVVVLSLLHRLRSHHPETNVPISGRVRPASLVSTEQLGIAFSLAVQALYGPGKLAQKLESAPGTRAAEERRLIDNLLLWFAREVGADCLRQPSERLDPQCLQARADLGPIAMSAAAYETLEPWAVQRDPWLTFWDDAVTANDGWSDRQRAYGLLLQRLRGQPRAESARRPIVGDIVLWAGERDLPWVVASVSDQKMSLIGPAGVQNSGKRVIVASTTVLDASTLGQRGPEIWFT